jgi:hypothetical protein
LPSISFVLKHVLQKLLTPPSVRLIPGNHLLFEKMPFD